MVVTHKAMKAKKKKGFPVKEDNSARKNMSKADALADNARLKEEKDALESFKQQLKDERKEKVVDTAPPPIENPSKPMFDQDKDAKILKLQKKISEEKGPGSRARKEKIQAKIDKLNES